MDQGYILVTTTFDSRDQARDVARTLLDEKLAACVEIQTVDSLYRWRGAVCDTIEYVLMIKTRGDLYTPVQERICALHTYELPQIVAVPILSGLPGYLKWIDDETRT